MLGLVSEWLCSDLQGLRCAQLLPKGPGSSWAHLLTSPRTVHIPALGLHLHMVS